MNTTVVIRRPSDDKISIFLENLELGATVISLGITYPILCDLLIFYGGRKDDLSFFESRRFLPIMLEEGDSYFGKYDLFFFLRNCLLDRTAVKRAFLFC